MTFLVDAQLPARLAGALAAAGHDALHTSELPDGNRTTDVQVSRRADAEGRIVVTKDADFRDSHHPGQAASVTVSRPRSGTGRRRVRAIW